MDCELTELRPKLGLGVRSDNSAAITVDGG